MCHLQVRNNNLKRSEIVTNLIKNSELSIEELKRNMQTKSGVDILDFILEDIQQLKKVLFNSQSIAIIMAGMNASSWINERWSSG